MFFEEDRLTVMREMIFADTSPDRAAALNELYSTLKPGAILSITEVIFDPHFQRRELVLRAARGVGFRELKFFGRRWAYTLHLEKAVDA